MATADKIDARKDCEIAKVMVKVVIHNIGGTRLWEEIKPLRENRNMADVWSTEGGPSTNPSK